MVKWYQLSRESIEASQVRMALRAVIAGPIHIALFAMLMWNQSEMRAANHWLEALFAVVVSTTLARTVLWKFSARVLAMKNGQAVFRWIFASLSIALGIAWGLCEGLTFHFYADRMESFFVLSCCVGICAASVTAYSFDFMVNAIFQAMVTLPTVIVLGMHGGGPFWTLAIGSALNVVFLVAMAANLHRNQVDLLAHQETIEKQKSFLEAAHGELKRNHDLIRTMLESIEEAFLIFDLEGVCVSDGSTKAKEFFGVAPKGEHLFKILAIPEEERKRLDSWFFIIKADQFDFHETAARGPKFHASADKKRTFSLNYRPMRDQHGALTAIVLTAVDVTRELEAKKAEQEALERSEMILRVNENMMGFRAFLKHFETALDMLKASGEKKFADVRRELHTLKGVAAIFGAKGLSRDVYGVELELRKFEPRAAEASPLAPVPPELLQGQLKRLLHVFGAWKQKEMGLFVQLGVFEDEKVVISKRRLSDVEQELSNDKRETFRQIINKLMASEFGEQLKDFSFHVGQVAEKLGKKAELRVEWESEPVFSRPETYLEVTRAMVHLFNNAVDHGIEQPADRLKAGKAAQGTILVRYGSRAQGGKDWLRVVITDDGRGIDVGRLRARAETKGRSFASKSDLEVMQTIFDEGVTTREEVTEVSGQGVGMGALRAAVLKARGKISIAKSDSAGTTFEILLPPPAATEKPALQQVRPA